MIKVLYAFENFTSTLSVEESNNVASDINFESIKSATGYDITFTITNNNGCIDFNALYNAMKYDDYEITLLLNRIIKICEEICINPYIKISELKFITDSEKSKIISEFNNTATDYPKNKTVVEIFEEQVEKNPDRTAVIFEEKHLTYKELNEKANALAYKLINTGVKPDDFVAVISERCIETIVSICAILKAGGAYVPIDPTYPENRIRFILEDCCPKAVINCVEDNLSVDTSIPIVKYTNCTDFESEINNPENNCTSENLVYCIYTSGTTGNPKGSLIENRSVIRLVKNNNYVELNDNTVILQTGSISFDASTFEIWGSLLNGGVLVLARQEAITDRTQIISIIEKQKINTLWLTSTLFNQMISEDKTMFNSLKYLMIGGEKLSDDHVRMFKNSNKNTTLINGYGPTENTTFTTTYKIPDDFEEIPIGKPISNTEVYILQGMQMCGIGVPGELCISGAGLARGYLNRPELTAEKFIDNPFGEGKLYRSGDLARWIPDGNIEYLGRVDEQVKIRGFRIELGEIESKIREIKGVKDSAVIAKIDKGGDKAIFAYYTSEEKVNSADIRQKLSKSLPEYMIPSYIMQIERIPLTTNGKLNKRALPDIEAKTTKEYVAPRTEKEKVICEIFGEILGVEKVGINDGFFELGGHSLRATRLVNSIEAKLGVKIALKDVFTNTTPEQLAKLAENSTGDEYTPIPKAEEKEYYPMSSAQKRTYLIQQMEPDAVTYNMPQSMKLEGEVYPDKLKSALQEMTDRHEILRTEFLTVEGECVQKILPSVISDFEYVSASLQSDEEIYNEFVRPFDLNKAQNVRVKLVNKGEYHLLLIDMHHIISDGMSMNTFTEELIALYNGTKLEPLTHQFKDYSEWMRTRDLDKQREYWVNEFSDEIPVLEMPVDYARPKIQTYNGASISRNLGKDISDAINRLSQKTGATAYMIILASLMVMLSKYSRQEDIVIGSPISGRTHKDTEKILGMFVNTLAMRGRPEGDKTFLAFLKEVKESCLRSYENQEYPFEELVENVNVNRDLSRNPLFDVLFVLQNNEQAKAELSDVNVDNSQISDSIAKFELEFNAYEYDGVFSVLFIYCTDLYKKETANKILNSFVQLLKNLTTSPELKINEFEMISDEEKVLICEKFNDTAKEYLRNKPISKLFEENVEKNPNNIAVVCGDKKLTFKQLNDRANALADKLIKLGVRSDDFVAIIADRSVEMMIAIIGILKSGGAYVPIDPRYPQDRVEYILNDCNPKAVVVYLDNNDQKIGSNVPVINLADKEIFNGEFANPVNVSSPEDAVYCIYTSGTTGQPKGVVIRQLSLINLCLNFMTQKYDSDVLNTALVASYAFDASVKIIFSSLLNGRELHIISDEIKTDIDKLSYYLKMNRIDLMDCTPTHLKMFISGGRKSDYTVKYVFSGGEELSNEVAENIYLLKYFGNIINVYGPTECTVDSTSFEIAHSPEKVYIGKPINNVQIYILNSLTLCGIGVPGELCIAGDGVARGYLNRPELTAEK
ncbi:MAG: amino acid adenylation domain-containing protein, partial [Ruminococcus sp.]|nr:amino acid adenylation domain-containing protein [Ruminococcus sp.]